MDDELLALMDEGIKEACRFLVKKIQNGDANASDINQLRTLHREAGGTLNFAGKATHVGDSVLESMKDIDERMFN